MWLRNHRCLLLQTISLLHDQRFPQFLHDPSIDIVWYCRVSWAQRTNHCKWNCNTSEIPRPKKQLKNATISITCSISPTGNPSTYKKLIKWWMMVDGSSEPISKPSWLVDHLPESHFGFGFLVCPCYFLWDNVNVFMKTCFLLTLWLQRNRWYILRALKNETNVNTRETKTWLNLKKFTTIYLSDKRCWNEIQDSGVSTPFMSGCGRTWGCEISLSCPEQDQKLRSTRRKCQRTVLPHGPMAVRFPLNRCQVQFATVLGQLANQQTVSASFAWHTHCSGQYAKSTGWNQSAFFLITQPPQWPVYIICRLESHKIVSMYCSWSQLAGGLILSYIQVIVYTKHQWYVCYVL